MALIPRLRALVGKTRSSFLCWPLAERIALPIVALWLCASALLIPARMLGDAGEYLLMGESFVRHLSPAARPADVIALADKLQRQGTPLNFAPMLEIYLRADDGRQYCYHFWGYSLAGVPAKLFLRLLGIVDVRALQLTNALLFLLALHQLLATTTLTRGTRRALAALTFFSPIAWYVLWPHPEAACASAVLLALLWSQQGRHVAAVLAASLATMQNPPLVLLVFALWLRALLPQLASAPRTLRTLLRRAWPVTLATLPAALPPLFYLWKFGELSPLARVSTDPRLLSPYRALELFFDPNLGMLPYAPGIVILFLAATVTQLSLRSAWLPAVERLALLTAMALSSTITQNWNSGAAGLSRYGVWLLPFLLMAIAESLQRWSTGTPPVRRLAMAAVALAVLGQGTVFFLRGGLVQGDDSTEHSYASRIVLAQAPALYNPTPHIFVSRTRGEPSEPAFAVYRDPAGRCRKAYARPKDGASLIALCGELPPGSDAYFAQTTGRKVYAYVSY